MRVLTAATIICLHCFFSDTIAGFDDVVLTVAKSMNPRSTSTDTN